MDNKQLAAHRMLIKQKLLARRADAIQQEKERQAMPVYRYRVYVQDLAGCKMTADNYTNKKDAMRAAKRSQTWKSAAYVSVLQFHASVKPGKEQFFYTWEREG